ncbi:esterase-like activity of phytase family protein [Thiobaca trueperi]|nr:esterase-like activity of phytase family protein [Thiobaca trueperi]
MMRTRHARWLLPSAMLVAGGVGIGQATVDDNALRKTAQELRAVTQEMQFQRIATLGNYRNLGADAIDQETVSEIVAATKDGMMLVYTDSPGERIGFVSIVNPASPIPKGTLAMGGEPTSVDVLGNEYALVAVNTSEDYVNTSGKLVVVNVKTRNIVREMPLGGQPDSIKIGPNGRYAAIAIENERDEEVEVDGVEGGLPQPPAGSLVIVDMLGKAPAQWQLRTVALTGLASYGGDDPEPEFVDVNASNQAVVTLQENNHLAVVDLVKGEVIHDFDAGKVTLNGIDRTEDGVISLTESLADAPREPDAVTWLPNEANGSCRIATANEGDLFGGSRGFSLFDCKGNLLFDSGSTLEEIAVQHGHYPESRSENKGVEPEAIEYGRFAGDDYLFVGSERGSFVAVYKVVGKKPSFVQLLPAPLAPEGVLAIPSRNLLIASGESDDPSYGVRSSLMIYQLKRGQPTYPQIVSDDRAFAPIPWSALSGLAAVPGKRDSLLAVWDSYYSESRILWIDASARPAIVTDDLLIQGGTGNYDPEGIAVAPDNTFWIASEGNADDSRPNRLLQVNPKTGQVLREIGLPAEILACRKAATARKTLGSGFEGLAVQPVKGGYRLLVAQQRGWDYSTPECEDLDDDAGGLNARGEPNRTRIWTYDPAQGTWDHFAWTLAPLTANAAWVGLSEISRAPDGSYILIERDNLTGDFAKRKTLVRITLDKADDGLITQGEKAIHNLMPGLKANHGWITDKPEGVAVTSAGLTFVVTDNDGVEDWSGETGFLGLGGYKKLFK